MNKIHETKKEFSDIIGAYLSKKIGTSTFERLYYELWRAYRSTKEHSQLNEQSDNTLDKFFTTLDCYCADPELVEDGDLSEDDVYNEVFDQYQNLLEVKT